MYLWVKKLALSAALALTAGSIGATTEPVVRGEVTYHFDNPSYIDGADSTLRTTHARLQKLLKNELLFAYEVYLPGTEESFDSLIGGKFPDWGAAAAIPFWKRIVVKSPDNFSLNRSLTELLSHEYAHLAMAHRTGLHSVPRWFEEGFAQMVSMEWSWSENLVLNLAAVTGDLIPLREIDRVNAFGQARARLAYAQSYLTVQYFYDLYGIEAVNMFLDEVARGADMDRALMISTGSNYADFEQELHVYLNGRFNLIGLVSDTMYLWLGLAVVVIVGFILSLRRRKQYYDRWDDEEKLASTDFDYGDPDEPEEIDDDEPWRR
jgi:hypothetical protein